jgi:hypothetical protein
MFTDDTRVSARSDVLFTEIDGETVLLGQDAGIYYGLNEVGTMIWNGIQSGRTLAEIRDAITGAFEVTAESAWQDLTALLLELRSEHLIEDATR